MLLDAILKLHSEHGDMHSLWRKIACLAADLCEAEIAVLFLKNENKLVFAASNGVETTHLTSLNIEMGQGIAGWVALNKSHLVLNGEGSEFDGLIQEADLSAKNLLASPVMAMGKLYGVIEVINKNAGQDFEPLDIDNLDAFADQCAIAMDNKRLFAEYKMQIHGMQAQLDNIDKIRDSRINSESEVIIAKSDIMKEKLEIVSRLAITDSAVLILGESGVGKELAAARIHRLSARKNAPFIRVNCAALAEQLAESELFGHVKGAFSGAVATTTGRFEAADTGTIFLDEIADLPLLLQAKLLRVLQEKTFEKLGSTESITVDVRVLAATNKDIEKLVYEGKFRKDLYYRLNVLPIFIPPLRSRPQDIAELANHFLHKFELDLKKHFEGFSPDALQALISYSWPGNIRELRNCVERACVICKESIITKRDLLISDTKSYTESNDRDLKTALESFKAQFIGSVLMEHDWNQSAAAKTLDIQRTYLSRLIKELNIRPA